MAESGLVFGGQTYTHHAWYFDGIVPSAALVARFKRAHASAAAGVIPARALEVEQGMFDDTFIFKLASRSGMVAFAPLQLVAHQGMRFAVTSLRADVVARCVEPAQNLAALDFHSSTDPAQVRTALTSLPRECTADMLQFLLNLPARCDAYVYCQPDDRVVIARSTYRLDVDKLEAHLRRVIPKPLKPMLCMSRTVCMWCGTAPVAEGVKLSVCGKCNCVAYCSRDCQKLDWSNAHKLECGREAPAFNAATSLVISDRYHLHITRALNEYQKPQSARVPVAGGPPRFAIFRMLAAASKEQCDVMPMGWLVDEDLPPARA